MFEMCFKLANGRYGRVVPGAAICPVLPTRLERLAVTVAARMRVNGHLSASSEVVRYYVVGTVADLFPGMVRMFHNARYAQIVWDRVGECALRINAEYARKDPNSCLVRAVSTKEWLRVITR